MGIGDKLKAMVSSKHDDTTSGSGSGLSKAEQAATGHSGSGTGSGGALNKAETSAATHLPGNAGKAAKAEQDINKIPGGSNVTNAVNKSGVSGAGGQSGSGVQRAEQAVEGHLPGHHSQQTGSGVGNQSSGYGGNTGSGSGSGTGYGSSSGNTGSGTGYGSTQGTGNTGSGTGYGSTQGTTGGSSRGVTGADNYTGGNTGGSSRSYQVGNPAELEGRRGEMSNIVGNTPNVQGTGSSVREDISTQYDKQHWREAIEKTDLAEKEVATASMQADQADQALAKAQRAQQSMGQHASEHDRLLAEAERQRGLVNDPSNIRGGLNSAQGDLTDAQRAAAAHNQQLRDADAAYAAKKGELDGLAPKIRAHDQKLQGLGSEYDNAMAKRDAVAADAERLRGKAAEADSARSGIASSVEQLMEKLRLAEEDMVARERAFLQSRDNHRSLHEQLRRARGELDGVNAQYEKNAGAADAALQSAQGWDDKTARLRNQLQEHESEHNRLLDLINRLKSELEALLAELEGLRRHGQPNKQAIEQAELRVNDHRNRLREAEAQAKSAEARYRQLITEADQHKARAADAANQANRYGDQYQNKVKEAELHGDRHAQLWNEAQQAGNTGSSNATTAFEKLKNRVENFAHREP